MEQDGSSPLHQEAEVVGVVASQRNGEVGGAVEGVGEGDGAYRVGVEAGGDRDGVHGGRLHALALDGEHLAAKLEGEVCKCVVDVTSFPGLPPRLYLAAMEKSWGLFSQPWRKVGVFSPRLQDKVWAGGQGMRLQSTITHTRNSHGPWLLMYGIPTLQQ